MHQSLSVRKIGIISGAAFLAASAVFVSVNSARAADAPTVAASIHTSAEATTTAAVIGSTVHGFASVASSTGSTPSGTVDFLLFANQSCSGTPLVQSAVALSSGRASSSPATVTASGLSYQVHYNGDSANGSADSTCASLAPVKIAPTLALSLSTSTVLSGSSVTATPNLSGESATASGTIAYKVYANSSCSNSYFDGGTKSVVNGAAGSSDPVQFNAAGTYYWQGVYSGDLNNNAATSSCSGAVLSVVATSTPTPPAPGTVSGTVFNDVNRNGALGAGEPGISGATVLLHHAATTSPLWIFNKSILYNLPVAATALTDGSGHYSFGGLQPGFYFIEEKPLAGWSQKTEDRTVKLTQANPSAVVDFANIAKATSTANGGKGKDQDDDDKGKGNDNGKKNGDDNGNKPDKFLGNPGHDNGKHLGWFKNFFKFFGGKKNKD